VDSAGRSHAWAEFVDDRTGKKGRSAIYERDYVYTKRMDRAGDRGRSNSVPICGTS
jgi:hypothetical protein